MFDMAHELGSLLNVRNRLGLTPLTLAAKLARRDMFFHILKIQKEVYWQLGKVTFAWCKSHVNLKKQKQKNLGTYFLR